MKNKIKYFWDITIIIIASLLMIIGKMLPFISKPIEKFITKVLKCKITFSD